MLAFVVAAALAPCAPDTPPALTLTGIPPVAIPGRSYEASLIGDGPVDESAGSDIAVTDSSGRGWSAHYEFARGVTQAFSVGIARAPFTVSATWTEPVADGTTCTRTVQTPLPIERRILAVVHCRRGAAAATGCASPHCAGRAGTRTSRSGAAGSRAATRRSRSRRRARVTRSTASSTRVPRSVGGPARSSACRSPARWRASRSTRSCRSRPGWGRQARCARRSIPG